MSFRLIILAGSVMTFATPPVIAETARSIATEATVDCLIGFDDPDTAFTLCACMGQAMGEIVNDPDLYDRMRGKPGAGGKIGMTPEEEATIKEPYLAAMKDCMQTAMMVEYPPGITQEEEDRIWDAYEDRLWN